VLIIIVRLGSFMFTYSSAFLLTAAVQFQHILRSPETPQEI